MISWLCSIMIGHCDVCYQMILPRIHSRVIKCAVSNGTYHVNCISMPTGEQLSTLNNEYTWYFSMCLPSKLPFNHYFDDDEFLDAIYVKDHFELHWDSFLQKLFSPFDFNDNESGIPLNDIDPNMNLCNEIFGSFRIICNYQNRQSKVSDVGCLRDPYWARYCSWFILMTLWMFVSIPCQFHLQILQAYSYKWW